MASYARGAPVTTAARPQADTAPHTSEPAPAPRAVAAPSRGPPCRELRSTRTSSGPGVTVRTRLTTANPQRPCMGPSLVLAHGGDGGSRPDRRGARPAGTGG